MTVTWNIADTVKRVERLVDKGVLKVAEFVKNDAVRRIVDPPKTGRVYSGAPFRIGRPPHQASAPGESPADDTGALRRSGKATRTGRLKAEVTFDAGYARNLEYGIPTGNYPLEPRPFLRPATLEGVKQAKRIIEGELTK